MEFVERLKKIPKKKDSIEKIKKVSLNFLLKVSTEMDSLINLGTPFHNLGAANRKARSPRVALGLTFG